MQLSSIMTSIAILAILPTSTLARPQLTNSSAPPTNIAPPARYYLKTKVVSGGDLSKDKLYVSSYHTGAGLNDVTLEASKDVASIGFLNDTYQQFDFRTDFPWSLEMAGSAYAAWSFVFLNAGLGSEGFFLNGTGLQWGGYENADGPFAGWLACDWWHGVPQLFWKFPYTDYAIPSSCAPVEIYPEDAEDDE